MAVCKKILYLVFVTLLYVPTHSQRIFFEQITTAEGLPSDYVNCMFQDSKGCFWIGTDKGACRFDGRHFQYFNNDNGLSSNFVSCFSEDPSGNIWIGTINAGISRYDGKSITPFQIPGNIKPNIFKIVFNKDGSFFVVTDQNGVYYFPDEYSEPHHFKDKLFIKNFKPGFFITGNRKEFSLIELKNKQPVFYPLPYPDVKSMGYSYFLVNDDKVVATKQNVFFDYTSDGKQWLLKKEYKISGENPFNNWRDVKQIMISDDEVFIATTKGLFHLDKYNKEHLYTAENGLGTDYINFIFKDRNSNIYICTYGGGIKVWPKGYITEYKTNGKVTSIFSAGDNTFLTSSREIYKYLPSDKILVALPISKSGYYSSLIKDKNGSFYLGTLNAFYKMPASLFETDPVILNNTQQSFQANTGSSGFAFLKNELLVSSYGDGIYVVDNKGNLKDTLDPHTTPPAPQIVESLVQLDNGVAALTYNVGLIIYDSANHHTSISREEGLLSNSVYSIFQENGDNLWIGTRNGLNLFDGNRVIKSFSTKDGLIGTKVMSVFKDRQNRLWVLSDKYLHFLDGERLRAIRSHPILFDNKNSINRTGYNKQTDILFIGLTDALLAVNMSKVLIDSTIITPELSVFLKDSEPITFTPDNSISVSGPGSRFTFKLSETGNFLSDQSLIYYKLKGFDNDWSLLSGTDEIYYQKLPPGNYELFTKVTNPDGFTSPEISMLSLEILPPVWKRNWFIFLVSMLMLGIFFFIGQVISKRKYKNKLRSLQEEYRVQLERERIARELHDNVGSHLTYLINKIDDDHQLFAEKEEAEKLGGFARNAMQELRETIWALDKKEVMWDDLENKIRQLARLYKSETRSVELDWQTGSEQQTPLNPLEALNIYRIIQEGLNNAEKYSNANKMYLKVTGNSKQVSVELSDNGSGFDISKTEKGYGLRNMQKRAEEMKAVLEINSAENNGTTIKLTLNRNQPFS